MSKESSPRLSPHNLAAQVRILIATNGRWKANTSLSAGSTGAYPNSPRIPRTSLGYLDGFDPFTNPRLGSALQTSLASLGARAPRGRELTARKHSLGDMGDPTGKVRFTGRDHIMIAAVGDAGREDDVTHIHLVFD